MDVIKVILGIIFGLIMLGWIVTVIVMACGPWVAVVIAAIALTIYLNRDWLRLHSNNSSLTYWHDKMAETPDKMSCCDWSRGWSDRCKSLIITPFYSSSTLFKTVNLSDQLPSCKISIILTFRKLLFNNNNFIHYFEV